MLEYPKIDTLYRRDEVTRYIPKFVSERSMLRPEFSLPSRWLVTEKIDGTNIRVIFEPAAPAPDGGGPGCAMARPARVRFAGRTDNAQIPSFLLSHLQETFPPEKLVSCFEPDTTAILFGEGYGARIQKGGDDYRSGVSFRLFDVVAFGLNVVTSDPFDGKPWWLNWNDVEDVAGKLSIKTVPVVGRTAGLGEAIQTVEAGLGSAVAYEENERSDVNAEGVVARTDPLLFDRRGRRLMWKLKERDFDAR
jgi:hypothetical protein